MGWEESDLLENAEKNYSINTQQLQRVTSIIMPKQAELIDVMFVHNNARLCTCYKSYP